MAEPHYWLQQAALTKKLAAESDRPDVAAVLENLAQQFQQRAFGGGDEPKRPPVIKNLPLEA